MNSIRHFGAMVVFCLLLLQGACSHSTKSPAHAATANVFETRKFQINNQDLSNANAQADLKINTRLILEIDINGKDFNLEDTEGILKLVSEEPSGRLVTMQSAKWKTDRIENGFRISSEFTAPRAPCNAGLQIISKSRVILQRDLIIRR